jgi:hypothetical protein
MHTHHTFGRVMVEEPLNFVIASGSGGEKPQ